VCGTRGTIATVTKVQCLCDVSRSRTVHQKRLQGSFSRTDMRTLIKYHVLWGKSTPREELKEGLGTHAPSYKTVC
jgi:hypothetical protein